MMTELLRPPKLVLLRGDLGAGKTTLVKGIVSSLGAAEPDDVASPTFTLVHEYNGRKLTVYHLDLYRLENDSQLEALGDLGDAGPAGCAGAGGVGRAFSFTGGACGRRGDDHDGRERDGAAADGSLARLMIAA